ncbi:mechanosensitive ion channel [Erythrobacter sp. 3-20A1M]|uniref:mechanosensitive ion channel n=1 Tax=Erythrobacter sp. 3-20A1M TaxID=2653850 RepID=UPI001BFBF75B|nr:mechanosensitive ion channel [Erythrobacter sp. 3-20A1M]QWC57103.1 mechanosensitive ion channel [Erythrobacter sp. 3-20A1M]
MNYQFDQSMAMSLAQKAIMIVVIIVVTWLLARAAKWAFAKLVDKIAFFRRGTGSGSSLGESLGRIVSLLIWLLGLIGVLQVLDLGGVMQPVTNLLNAIVAFIPNLIGAGLILFIGLMVAGIVRDLVVTTLQTVDFDRWANRAGADNVTGNNAISRTIGVIVYVLIVIPVAILALDALDLESIAGPASDMLRMILDAIPRIIGAAILLGIGYVISRFVVDILKQLMAGFGVDRALGETGLLPEGTLASSIIARVAQIAIILFFAIAATRLLNFPELTAILNEVLALGSRVVFGAVVIGFGFLIANLLARVIGGTEGGSTAATIVRWATIVLFTFMGLQFTGVGEIITETAFTAIVIGIAVAGALAFGLGGRAWAARQLDKWDERTAASPGTAPRRPGSKPTSAPESDEPLPPGA